MLTEYRKDKVPSFVLKIGERLYFSRILYNLSMENSEILLMHKCYSAGHTCKRLSSASDELGGCHSVGQQLELGLLKGPGGKIVEILFGPDRPNIVTGGDQCFHVPLHRDAVSIQPKPLFQQPDAFRRGKRVICVAVGLQKLQHPQQPHTALAIPAGAFFPFHSQTSKGKEGPKRSA